MGINRVTKRGQTRTEVRKQWPDGKTFRRYFPSMSAARHVLARIEGSIATGTWPELRRELCGAEAKEQTLREFSQVFLKQYAAVRIRSWQRYELSLRTLNDSLGGIRLSKFHRRHLHGFVQERVKQVAASTVNRDIACLKKLFSYAFGIGAIEDHPPIRFPLLPIQEKAFRVMTIEEYRRLIASMERASIAAMVTVMGETGLRKGEALSLLWEHVDLRQRMLTVEHTKSRKVREIPLSDLAVESLTSLTRRLDTPQVFLNSSTGKPWVNPEKPFRSGCKKADLKWVGFHDLRRFRATQWVRMGVDLRTVKELLGHADIQTTMRYARFVKSALSEVRQAQQAEMRMGEEWETNGRQQRSG